MKSIYYLLFLAAYLLYSANQRGLHSELSQGKLLLALLFVVIPVIYWIVDKVRGDRRWISAVLKI